MSEPVKVDVEYCKVCHLKAKCEQLADIVHKISPHTEVTCNEGRQGSFEVQINGTLVHSRLASVALPDFMDVAKNANLAAEGKPLLKVNHQPIIDCVVQ